MSRLNKLDALRQETTVRAFYELYQEFRKQLARSRSVTEEELELLVFGSYHHSVITEGKACEILNVNRLKFRERYEEFLDKNTNLLETYND